MCDLSNDGGTPSPSEILFRTECFEVEVHFVFPVLLVPLHTSDESISFHLKASVRYLKFLKNMLTHCLFA